MAATKTRPPRGATPGTNGSGPLPLLSADAVLGAPSDLVEELVEVPEWGGSVKIRTLTAEGGAAVQEATIVFGEGGTLASVNLGESAIALFLHGVAEPQFTEEQVRQLAAKSGPGFARVLTALNKLNGNPQEAAKQARAAFPPGN